MNVVVNSRGDIVAVMLCDKNARKRCLIVEESSGEPLLVAMWEAEDRYFVVSHKTGEPFGRLLRVGRKVWQVFR